MRPSAAIAILSLLPLSAAVADVYRSIDAQGHVLYSDSPTPGAQLVRTGGNDSLFTPPAPTAAAKPNAAPKSGDAAKDVATQQAARAVQADEAQTHADQCKKAKEAYEKSIAARRIYNVDADGQRQYLSDADAEQQRVNNKLQMDELCKDVDGQ